MFRITVMLFCMFTVAGTFAQNQPPVAPAPKTRTTNEDTPVNVTNATTSNQNLLFGFTDPDQDALAITDFTVDGVTTAAGTVYAITGVGSVRIDAGGTYNFTPALNYNGPVPTITYTVSDGNGGTAAGSLTITLNAVNDNIANTIPSYNTTEDTPLTLNRVVGGTPSLSIADVDAADPRGTNSISTKLAISYDAQGSNPNWIAYAGPLGTLTAADGSDLGVTIATSVVTGPTRPDGSTPDSLIVTLNGPIDAINNYFKDPAGHPIVYTPPADLYTSVCISSLRISMITYDKGNYGLGANKRDITTRLIGISAVRDITNDAVTAVSGTTTTFNVLTGTNGATADNFENPDRAVMAINGAPVTSGQTITLPSGNTVTVNSDGTMNFTAPPSETAYTDSFTYSVLSAVCPETATVTLNISRALPVKLVSFDGNASEGTAVLDWSTSEEANSAFFEIERAADAKAWRTIGSVPAKGYSNAFSRYRFTDTAPLAKGYYRLKQVDSDGHSEFSAIVSVLVKGGAKIYISPNPTDSHIELTGVSPQSEIVIYTFAGIPVQQIVASVADPKIPVSHLSPGLYLVSIPAAGGREKATLRFMKR